MRTARWASTRSALPRGAGPTWDSVPHKGSEVHHQHPRETDGPAGGEAADQTLVPLFSFLPLGGAAFVPLPFGVREGLGPLPPPSSAGASRGSNPRAPNTRDFPVSAPSGRWAFRGGRGQHVVRGPEDYRGRACAAGEGPGPGTRPPEPASVPLGFCLRL